MWIGDGGEPGSAVERGSDDGGLDVAGGGVDGGAVEGAVSGFDGADGGDDLRWQPGTRVGGIEVPGLEFGWDLAQRNRGR